MWFDEDELAGRLLCEISKDGDDWVCADPCIHLALQHHQDWDCKLTPRLNDNNGRSVKKPSTRQTRILDFCHPFAPRQLPDTCVIMALSSGAIAGFVIASIISTLYLVYLVYYLCTYRSKHGPSYDAETSTPFGERVRRLLHIQP
jgi:hypothetical protein